MSDLRKEKDSLGFVEVPSKAYYGAQTARAVDNFPISGISGHAELVRALGMVKRAAAQANKDLGLVDGKRADAIIQAAQEVIDGKWNGEFVVDVFQAGAGVSQHMNTNEVIASRANEIATGKRGGKDPIHPNDHVNMEQSSNDVIPTAMHVSAAMAIKEGLIPALGHLEKSLRAKATAYDNVVKIGNAGGEQRHLLLGFFSFGDVDTDCHRGEKYNLSATMSLSQNPSLAACSIKL